MAGTTVNGAAESRPVLSIDFETRATVDLKSTGVYPYAAHPDTDVWCMAWAFDDEEPEIWVPSQELPRRIFDHIGYGGELRAWNAQFERIIWDHIMVPRYGAPRPMLHQWVCSAAEAAAMALPRSLDGCSRTLGITQTKDKAGYDLMLRMTRPRKIVDGRPVWWDVPERIARLHEYCKQDVRVERALVKCLRRLTPHEREVYLLDQRMNDRGVRVDTELVRAARDVVSIGMAKANGIIAELTCGEVSAVTNHGRLLAWLRAQGVETDSVSKAAVAGMLDGGDLSQRVRDALEIRAEAGRSSVAKLDSMLAYADVDGRMRGTMLYHAASTGRWGGKGPQPHNYPRGEVDDVEGFIPAVLARDYEGIDLIAPPIVVVSSMLRAMLYAAEGCDLIAADFSAIEARVLNWLAGQEDILALFAAGEDVYKHNAVKLYGIPLAEVKKFPHRQTGKFQELGCGFQMGAKKAVSAAKAVYGLDITEEQAKEIVSGYRSTHDRVVDFWYATEAACIAATEEKGKVFTFGARSNLKAVVAGAYLYVALPSGRTLCYAVPKVEDTDTPWGTNKATLTYMGVDPFTGQWSRLRTYGGHLVENIVQATARDLLADGLLRAEQRGYTPILSVHDEAVAEVAKGFGSVEEFEQILCELPAWAEGCPVAAEGWRGERYRK